MERGNPIEHVVAVLTGAAPSSPPPWNGTAHVHVLADERVALSADYIQFVAWLQAGAVGGSAETGNRDADRVTGREV